MTLRMPEQGKACFGLKTFLPCSPWCYRGQSCTCMEPSTFSTQTRWQMEIRIRLHSIDCLYPSQTLVIPIPDISGPYQVMNRLNDINSIQDLVSAKVIDTHSCTSAPTFQQWSWEDSTSRHSTTDSSGISHRRYPSSSWWSKSQIHVGILREMGRFYGCRLVGAICRTPTCRETAWVLEST